jgi:hypothetical protein
MECLYSLPPIFARATVRLPLPGLVRRFELANFDQSRSWVGKTPPLRSIIFPLGRRLAGEEKLSARAKSNKYRVGFLKGAINERTGVVRAARLPSSLGLCRAKPATSAPLCTIEGRERNFESLSCFVLRLCISVLKPALH